MADEKRRRRTGRGGLSKYQTRQGERWRWRLYVPLNPEHPEDGETRTGKAGFKTQVAADNDMQKAIAARAEKLPQRGGERPTVERQAQAWFDALDRDELSPATLQGYLKIVRNHIVPALGDIRVDNLTSSRIGRHYRELRASGSKARGKLGEPLSANSVNKVHIVLGAILDSAIDDGYIQSNPAKRKTVKAPTGKAIRKARPEIETWTAEQLSSFLTWDRDVFNDDLFTLWRVIAFTGMRRSEALALQWRDLSLPSSRLSVRRAVDVTQRDALKATKSDRPRVLDIDAETVAALSAWKKKRAAISFAFVHQDAPIFGLLRDNRLRSPNELNKRWNYRVGKAVEALKIPRLTIKGLRHTHATILLELGTPPKVVQERLGHASISITMDIYSHVSQTMQASAITALASAVDGA